jgi:Phage-related protein
MTLPLAARIEKNKTSTDSAMIWLLDIMLDSILYLTNNNENVTWNNQEYLAFPFTVGNITDDGKENMSIQIQIANVTRELGVVISNAKGGGGTQIKLRVVNSALLDDLNAVYIEETFQITKTEINANWVTLTIGIPRDLIQRFPMRSVFRDFCPYARLGDIECGYNGLETSCNRTLKRCRELGNAARFGGEPGLTGNLG